MNDAAIDPDTIMPTFDPNEAWFVVLACLAVAACLGLAWVIGRRIVEGRPVVPAVPHPAAAWDGGVVAVVVGLLFVSQIFGVALHDWWAGSPAQDGVAITPQRLAAASGATALAAAASVAVLLRAGATPRSLGLFSEAPLEDFRLAVATLVAMTPPLLVASGLLNRIVPYEHPIIDLLEASQGPATLFAVVISAVVVAPLAEEFVFRGVLQGWLEATEARLSGWHGPLPQPWRAGGVGFPWSMPGVAAVGGSAVCFALAHLGHGLGWIPLVGFGVGVGFLRRQRGSLLPGVLVHAMFNALSLLLLMLQM